MRILVTGASGLLGLNLALEAAREGLFREPAAVFGVANSHRLSTQAFEVFQSDLLAPGELERLLAKTQPDWVIHCAALAVIDACEADPGLAHQMNVVLPQKLAVLVARGGARLVHVSTDSIFDGQRGDYSEEDLPRPINVYARTKLDGEKAVLDANPSALVARTNMFGWSLSGHRSLAEWFFNNLTAGRQMMGFTDVYFCPLLVNDLANVLFRMLEAGLSGLYHVFSPTCTSKYDFGVALARRFGMDESLITPASVEQSALKTVRAPHLTMNVEKLRQALSDDLPTWQSGMERFYELYRQGYPQMLRKMDQS